jgi:hypothetical protein
VIWHDSFYKLLETIEHLSVTGCWVNCGDKIARHIYLLILILVADYKEQQVMARPATINLITFCILGRMIIRCIMALIRGVNSLYPCPRCLIAHTEQRDLSVTAPLRTTANAKATVQEAREYRLVEDREKTLKDAGLRDVDVHLRSHYLGFVLPLTTYPTERILEDQQLGPICRIFVRSASYSPWWYVSSPSLGSSQRNPRGIGKDGMRSG